MACRLAGRGNGSIQNTVAKPLGKCRLERPRMRWRDNIETDIREIGCEICIQIASFSISGIETSGPATTVLVDLLVSFITCTFLQV
jgi:hypothetical protein